jgi:hypothetical protein
VINRLCFVLLVASPIFGRTVDLGGFWDFRYDPENRGESTNWRNAPLQGWTRIQVPGSYNQAMRDNVLYQGKAWYRTSFEVTRQPGERVLLRFEGVAIRSKVWVNGLLAGEHLFPYTGFTFDVTGFLKPGRNELAVLADNQLLKDAIPDLACTGWWNYGGINRGVFLDIVPDVYLTGLTVTTKMSAAGWTFAVTGERSCGCGWESCRSTAERALSNQSERWIGWIAKFRSANRKSRRCWSPAWSGAFWILCHAWGRYGAPCWLRRSAR